jgi:pimeloyl-ACP methyl ester carboxylesterase
MAASFLPPEIAQLTEPSSIALGQTIQRHPILTPLRANPIDTALVHQGTGKPPIVLLHGFDSSVFEFRRLQPLLAEMHETWNLDLLGFGFSDRPTDLPFTPTDIKTHLYCTWKTLINQPIVLVGASMGGAAAIDFALTYPEVVQQLVLIDSAGFAVGPAMGNLMIPPLGYLAASFLRNSWVRRKVSLQAYFDPKWVTVDSERCAALHLKLPGWQEAIIAFTKSGGYNFLSEKISKITSPTLILWGDSDRILGIQDAEKFKTAIAESRLVWVNQCGHVPHLEKPEETAAEILSFIAATPTATKPTTSEMNLQ